MNLLTRFADWRRERRIDRLRGIAIDLYNRDLREPARVVLRHMYDEIDARSRGQIQRMEAAQGLAE